MRWRMTSRRTRLVLVSGLLFVVASLAAGIWRLRLHDTAKPASAGEALKRFRSQTRGNGGRIPAGVYVYATKGFESVSALGGIRHRYPARSTITITRAPCGTALRWDVLTTRWDAFTICGEGGGLRLAGWSERHEFFGRADRTDWRCRRTAWLPAKRRPGSLSLWRCRSSDSTQEGTTRIVGADSVLVGAKPVKAIRLRASVREAGGARGIAMEERWLEPETGLPLRIDYRVRTKNPSPIGDVTFEERFELRLLSLEPRR